MGQMAEVKGTAIMEQQAAAGLKLFGADTGPAELDVAGAESYKADIDAKIAALEAEMAKLTGKDNKKERAAKGKEVSELKAEPKYVDACKVAKGLEPKNGHFAKYAPALIKPAAGGYSGSAPPVAPPPAPEKKAKKQESAGLSPAEKKELEKLKTDVVARKTQLKNEGLSGGQQNKDEQVVEMVRRMNELKEKEAPGSTAPAKKESKKGNRAPLSSEEMKELDSLRGEIEIYKNRLKTEFGYSTKDMKIDEDLQEMEARLVLLDKRS